MKTCVSLAMASGKCGSVNYVDVYNMTDSLVNDHLEEANLLTFDKVRTVLGHKYVIS